MKAIVLVDNIEGENLTGEWGLSIYIEHVGRKILLDAGATDLFVKNAEKLGIDLSEVDYAVLSHAHWDHADGLPYFFSVNTKAKLFLQNCCDENCYAIKEGKMEYIGIPEGLQKTFEERLCRVDGSLELCQGAYIIPHKTQGLENCGQRSKMYVKSDSEMLPDDFSHEQSLVLETEKGIVIFNSCSHGGADVIINEVSEAFPGKKICGMVGGFHLFDKTEEEVRALAEALKRTGVEKIYTGHCTGDDAMKTLKDILGEAVAGFFSGCVMEF